MSETVGLSGTRRPLTRAEQDRVREIVLALPMGTRIVHGACVGLDAFVGMIATRHGYRVHAVVPSDRSRVDSLWQFHCTTYEEMPEGTDYRDRNQRIVLQSDKLIAIPDHDEHAPESRRSGTWQTFRLARKARKRVEAHILCADCDRQRRATAAPAEDGGAGL